MDNWKKNLGDLFGQKQKEKEIERERSRLEQQRYADIVKEAHIAFTATVIPAFEEIKEELEKYQRNVKLVTNLNTEFLPSAELVVNHYTNMDGFNYLEEFSYKISCSPDAETIVNIVYMENKIIKEEFRDCVLTEENNILNIAKEDIIEIFLSCYERYI